MPATIKRGRLIESACRSAEHGIEKGEAEADQQAHLRVRDSEIAADWSNQEIQNLAINEGEDVGAEEDRDGVPGPGGRGVGAVSF